MTTCPKCGCEIDDMADCCPGCISKLDGTIGVIEIAKRVSQMTTKDPQTLIGKRFHRQAGKLQFTVEVLAVRFVYGRWEASVRPVAGDGAASWVKLDGLTEAK